MSHWQFSSIYGAHFRGPWRGSLTSNRRRNLFPLSLLFLLLLKQWDRWSSGLTFTTGPLFILSPYLEETTMDRWGSDTKFFDRIERGSWGSKDLILQISSNEANFRRKALISYIGKPQWMKLAVDHIDHNLCVTQWNCDLGHVGQPCRQMGHGRMLWQNVVHWEKWEWQTVAAFLLWEPHIQHEMTKRYNTERWIPGQ